MRHCALKGLIAVALVGMSAEIGAWSYQPTPFGMSECERQRIENEEAVRYNYRRGMEYLRDREREGEMARERLSQMDRANFRRMCGDDQEYNREKQAEALGALILLGALCEKAQEEQERQKAIVQPKQEESAQGIAQAKGSGQQTATSSDQEEAESTGAGVWLVLVLLGGAAIYVIYGELKHRSESRGKQMSKLNCPNIVCPHCGCVYEYDPELIGVAVQCASCKKDFVAQQPV